MGVVDSRFANNKYRFLVYLIGFTNGFYCRYVSVAVEINQLSRGSHRLSDYNFIVRQLFSLVLSGYD